MKQLSILLIMALSIAVSCKKSSQNDCSENHTGSILFHNPSPNWDSLHIILNGVDRGMIRVNNTLQIDNLPTGKDYYLFQYHGYDYSGDSITVTECNTLHFTIPGPFVSDKRLKKNITPVNDALANIQRLNIYSFEYNAPKNYNTYLPSGKHYGFMAQELKEVYPNFVEMNSNGYYSVNYQEMIPLLAQGMKEQQKEIDDLKQQIAQLKSMMQLMN